MADDTDRIWKDMSLNDSMTEVERARLAVWDYPVSDRYTKIWQSMQDARLPNTFEEALARVRASESDSDGFAFLGAHLLFAFVSCSFLLLLPCQQEILSPKKKLRNGSGQLTLLIFAQMNFQREMNKR